MEQVNYLERDFPTEMWLPLAEQGAVKYFSAGELIYLQESPASSFFYLKSGRVKSYIQSEEGDERVLNIYNQGSIFGEAAFFDELPRVSSAVAIEGCEVVAIDKNAVQQQFVKAPQLALAMIKYLARTVRILSNQVDDMAFRPVPQRLARYLLRHVSPGGEVRVTQEEIASSVSASRITVSRVLGQFVEKGWVETKYGTIVVQEQHKLEEFIGESP